ncbi:MAG: ABC transporter ATP-binding protein [Acidobacteriota bacterium]
MSSAAPALSLRDIWKSFGPVVANAGAALEVEAGEIHALVGENGAGKSTLMRLLAGLSAPDSGSIQVEGRDVTGWSPADAIAAGIGMVHQHFMLVPTLSVAENLVLGREPRRGRLRSTLDLEQARRDVERLVHESGLTVEPDALVGDLPVGVAQRVEILKALYRGAHILILDEPTAVLSPPEVTDFLRVLRTLRDTGTTVVLITHKLDEVMAVSDRITVMRRGKTVARLITRETSPAAIAQAMVGREVLLAGEESAATDNRAFSADAEHQGSLLSIDHLVVSSNRGTRAVDNLSLELRGGEILGIAGVEGNGQTELIEALAGLRKVESGRITLAGRDVGPLTVREREAAGLAHIPEDRHRRGLILDYTLAENLILGRQDLFSRHGLLDRAALQSYAGKQIAAFDIRPTDAAAPARTLSGGNQQKIVIAREMGHGFKVLLAAQPTRGVDVGAIEFIHRQLREARDSGKGVLLVSSELTEILALADRVAVLFRGRIVAMLPRSAASAEAIGPYMTGARGAAA